MAEVCKIQNNSQQYLSTVFVEYILTSSDLVFARWNEFCVYISRIID